MKSKIKHIYWFASFSTLCPSTRYRGWIPLNHLKSKNIKFDFIFPERSIIQILKFLIVYLEVLFFRKRDSLIVIQKVYTNRWYANALKILVRFRSKQTLYDLDDAEHYRRDTSTIEYFLRNCNIVSVGSQSLKDYTLKFNKNVFILTSPVTINDKSNLKEVKNDEIHIGWVGDFGNGNKPSKAFSHKTSLFTLFFPNLKKVEYPVKLSLIGIKNQADIPEIKDYFKSKPNIELDIPTNLDWINDKWVYEKISKFDIGISLMIRHPFNEAKSAFKAKQYLACGIPVIANNIGETSNFVFDRINGFICNSDEEITAAIDNINYMSKEKYLTLSMECFKNLNSFSVETYCETLLLNIDLFKNNLNT